MKILLLGKSGQVGLELQRSLASLGDLVALDRYSSDHCGDITDEDGLRHTILHIRPDVIVNAAAYTAVDRAESEEYFAQQANAQAVASIAKTARTINALLIHYSTDYVFSGVGDAPWREKDTVNPQNAYGRSKLAGEEAIEESGCNYLIFRTSWVYGVRGHNFLKTMLALASTKPELKIINDQYGAPTDAGLIADITAHCIKNFTVEKIGTYHLAAAGVTTWFEYAQFVFMLARKQGVNLLAKPEAIHPVLSKEFKVAARRPLNSRLNCEKICTTFGISLPDWRHRVEHTLIQILENENAKT